MQRRTLILVLLGTLALLVGLFAVLHERVASVPDSPALPMVSTQALAANASTTPLPVGLHTPSAKLSAYRDAEYGWNLHITTDNFHIGAAEELGTLFATGYPYLTIDGSRPIRLYDAWYHLPYLAAGPHQITLSLRSLQYQIYAVNEKTIEEQYILTIDGDKVTVAPVQH